MSVRRALCCIRATWCGTRAGSVRR
jgi:hypothetical protein